MNSVATGFNLLLAAAEFDPELRHQSFNALITPVTAKLIIDNYNYAHQRPLNHQHLHRLAEAMRRDEFREFTPIDFVIKDKKPVLVNGQHTLNAVIVSNKGIWLSVCMHDVKNDSKIEALYSKYDMGRKRGLRDITSALPGEFSLPKREIDCLGVAVGVIHRNFALIHGRMDVSLNYEMRDFEFIKSLMREWKEEAVLFFSLMKGTPNRSLFERGPVLAVALITLRHKKDMAIDFWRGAAMDDGLRIGDPRKTAIKWLQDHSSASAVGVQHKVAIKCWNNWCEEKKITKIYPEAGPFPLKIFGTDIEIKNTSPRHKKTAVME